jgi:hypothetical protein
MLNQLQSESLPLLKNHADQVDHSKLQAMFQLEPPQAEIARSILQVCVFKGFTIVEVDVYHELCRCLLQIGKLPWSMLPYPANQMEIPLVIQQAIIAIKT